MPVCVPVCVGPAQKPRRLVFSRRDFILYSECMHSTLSNNDKTLTSVLAEHWPNGPLLRKLALNL